MESDRIKQSASYTIGPTNGFYIIHSVKTFSLQY